MECQHCYRELPEPTDSGADWLACSQRICFYCCLTLNGTCCDSCFATHKITGDQIEPPCREEHHYAQARLHF